MAAKKYVQALTQYLSGSGVIIGATSITLTSLADIYGNNITDITPFGDKGYVTLEPDTVNEEAATFTGVTANANGTVTLTGVSTALAVSPYTETSGLIRGHSGGTKLVITDNVAFWNTFPNKNNDETITGQWTFTTFPITPAVPSATTSVSGTLQLGTQAQVTAKTATGSTGSSLAVTPDKLASVLLSDYKADTGSANTYAIAPAPAVTAYTVGQIFSFKAGNANTGASTLNVNSLGAKTLKRLGGGNDLVTGDILAGQIVVVEYDGTNFQLISSGGNATGFNVQTFTSSGTWTKPANAKSIVLMGIGSGGSGGGNSGNGSSFSGGGGGGGAINGLTLVPALITPTVTVTIGTGSVSATASTFGSYLSVAGGIVGAAPSGAGGVGGGGGSAGTGGIAGGAGANGAASSTFGGGGGGAGGSAGTLGGSGGAGGAAGTTDSNLGAGGNGGPTSGTPGAAQGSPGVNYGGGGGGAGYGVGTTSAGGAGAPGYMSVVTFF